AGHVEVTVPQHPANPAHDDGHAADVGSSEPVLQLPLAWPLGLVLPPLLQGRVLRPSLTRDDAPAPLMVVESCVQQMARTWLNSPLGESHQLLPWGDPRGCGTLAGPGAGPPGPSRFC